MLNITMAIEGGYNVFSFDARGTHYQILTDNGVEYILYTSRHSPRFFNSIEQLAQHSKPLRDFAVFIGAGAKDPKIIH